MFRRLGLSREFNGSHRMQHVPEKSYVLCSRILRLIESNGPSAALKDIEHELRMYNWSTKMREIRSEDS